MYGYILRMVMPWLSRKDYETMLRRNDDRDFAATLKAVERVQSDVRALRTWLQRNLDGLTKLERDEEPDEPDESIPVPTPGGWR